MEIILTEQERLNILENALCNAGHIHYGTMGLLYQGKDYHEAKDELTAKQTSSDVISREDVWIQMVKSGKKLRLQDYEGAESFDITLESIKAIDKMPVTIHAEFMGQNDDAESGDYVLEYIAYGEKIYG